MSDCAQEIAGWTRRFRHVQREKVLVAQKIEIEIRGLESKLSALAHQAAQLDSIEEAIVNMYLEARDLCEECLPLYRGDLHREREKVIAKCCNDPVVVLELIRASVRAQLTWKRTFEEAIQPEIAKQLQHKKRDGVHFKSLEFQEQQEVQNDDTQLSKRVSNDDEQGSKVHQTKLKQAISDHQAKLTQTTAQKYQLKNKINQQHGTLKLWQEGLSRIPSLEAEILAARRVMYTELHNQQVRLGKEKHELGQENSILEDAQEAVSKQHQQLRELRKQITQLENRLRTQNKMQVKTSSLVSHGKQAGQHVVQAKNSLRLAQQNLRRLRIVANKKAEQIQTLSNEYRTTVQHLQQQREEEARHQLIFQTYHVTNSVKQDVSMETYQIQLQQKEEEIAEMEAELRALVRSGMKMPRQRQRMHMVKREASALNAQLYCGGSSPEQSGIQKAAKVKLRPAVSVPQLQTGGEHSRDTSSKLLYLSASVTKF